MSFDDQKRSDIFISLDPSKFSVAIRDDANEFLLDFQERFHNLIFLGSHGLSYTTDQFTKVAIK